MSRLTNPFRYFIVPVNEQLHMLHTLGPYGLENKNQIVIDYLKKLERIKKTDITYRNSNYLLYSMSSFDERFFLLKLAKEKSIDIHVAGEEDVENIETLDYPYVYIIVDTRYQIVLIEYSSSVFANTETTANILSEFINKFSNEYVFEVSLNPMLKSDHFWETVQAYEKIIEAEFCLESPNLFDGIIDIETMLKKIKMQYNNTRSIFKLSNEIGTLNLDKNNEQLKSAVAYIGNGGGRWKLTVIKGGKKEPKESSEHIQKVVIDEDIENDFMENREKIQSYLSRVEDVMKDEEADY